MATEFSPKILCSTQSWMSWSWNTHSHIWSITFHASLGPRASFSKSSATRSPERGQWEQYYIVLVLNVLLILRSKDDSITLKKEENLPYFLHLWLQLHYSIQRELWVTSYRMMSIKDKGWQLLSSQGSRKSIVTKLSSEGYYAHLSYPNLP